MKMKKIVASVLTALVCASLFAGCSNQQASVDTDTAVNKLRILWWGTQARHDSTTKVLDMYSEKVGDVEFEQEFMGYSGYYEKISTLVAANNLPDIMQFDMLGISPYIKNKSLLDLTGLVNSGVLDLTDVAPSIIDSGKADGGLYALSLGTNAFCLAYNPDILKQAGVDEIPMDWSWSDMEEIFAKVKASTDAYPIDAVNFGQFHYYLRQKGASLYSEDGTKLGYDDDRLFVDFFDKYLEYIDKGYCIPPERLVASTSMEESDFAQGKIAMQINWSNSISSLEAATGREYKIVPLPEGEANIGMYTKPTLYFAVSANTKNAEKAGAFLSYFINDPEANKILNAERGVPVSSKIQELLKPDLNASKQKEFEYIEYVTEHSTAMDPLPPKCSSEIDQLLSEIDEQIRFKQIDTKTAAENFRKGAEGIFAKAK